MMLLGEIERSVQAAEDRGTESANTQGVLRFITAGSVDDGKSTRRACCASSPRAAWTTARAP